MTNQSNIQTGPTSGIKASAVNAVDQQKAAEAQAKQDADKLKPGAGDVLYTKPGEPTFNTAYGAAGKRLSFMGGKFMIRKGDTDGEEIKAALDYFVAKGILTRTEG